MQERKTRTIGVAAVILLLCVAATLTVVADRLQAYAPDAAWKNVISLVPASPEEASTGELFPAIDPKPQEGYSGDEDDLEKAWRNSRQVDIFKVSYDSVQGAVTVQGTNGARLVAPGTSNTYEFTIENTTDEMLEYDMAITAQVLGTDLIVPVQVRLWNYKGEYLVGGEDANVPFLDLNGVKDNGKLSAGYASVYTLEWLWPFEQGTDEYDTLLGNLAVGQDIILRIRIDTLAQKAIAAREYSDDEPSGDPSGHPSGELSGDTSLAPQSSSEIREDYGLPPKTGDSRGMTPIALVSVAVAAIAAVMTASAKERKKHEEG